MGRAPANSKIQCSECNYVWFPYRDALVRPHKKNGGRCPGENKPGKEPTRDIKPSERNQMPKASLVAAAVEARRREEVAKGTLDKEDTPDRPHFAGYPDVIIEAPSAQHHGLPNLPLKFCSVCGEPLRQDNESGYHTRCKTAGRRAGKPEKTEPVDPLHRLMGPLRKKAAQLNKKADQLEWQISTLHRKASAFRAAAEKIQSIVTPERT